MAKGQETADQPEQKADSLYHKRATYFSDNPRITALDLLVDSMLRSFMQSPQNCGLSIGIMQSGQSSFYNYGEPRRNAATVTGKTTLYETGSIGAGFTGFLLAVAVSEKKISLDDELRKYLPEEFKNLEYERKAIRIRHLATHTSGLPHLPDDIGTGAGFDPKNPYKNYSKAQIYGTLKRVRLSAVPGSVYDYSSLGLALLGSILEKIYGVPYDTLVKEKICKPLRLQNTGVHLTKEQAQSLAQGYTMDGDPAPPWDLEPEAAFAAAGSIRSCTEDLLRYLDRNLQEKDEASKLAQQLSITSAGKKVSPAWLVNKTKQGNTLYYQNGGTFGFTGFMGFVKEKKCAVVVMANSGGNLDYIAIALLNYLQQE